MAPIAIAQPATTAVAGGEYPQEQNGHSNGQTAQAQPTPQGVDEIKRFPSMDLKVLIVGCGPGGLMSALECWRKGMAVELIDRSDKPLNTGDVFCLQPSCMSVYRHWPTLEKEIEEEQYDAGISYWHNNGEKIYGPGPPEFNDDTKGRKGPHVGFMQGRIKFFNMLLRQVQRCGIPMTWGQKVTDYYEIEAARVGGVVLSDGSRKEADIVIAADGIKTSSGKLIAGYTPEPKNSGQSIYRSGYSPKHAQHDKLVQDRWPVQPGDKPEWQFWLGAGLHLSAMVGEDMIVWGLTHKDEYANDATENWSQQPNVDTQDVVELMERVAPGWNPAVKALIGTTPKGSLVHWKLRWRDLNQNWTSPGGRIVQVGDSAHSFLPASGNGATQALEDAVSLAACLQLAGKSNAAIATKVHNRLRYERISCAQIMSFVNTQQHHFTDWSAIGENPSLIRTRFPRWVWNHDPEQYAYEKYGEGFLHVVSNGEYPLKNTNYPPGHTHAPWSVDDVRSDLLNDVNIAAKLDGDWS